MLGKIPPPVILLISFILMYSVSGYQFYQDYSKFKILKQRGVTTRTTAEFIPKKLAMDYYKFTFTTPDGHIIAETGKCGDKERFDSFYSNLEVVYDPLDPKKYLEKPYLENYSLAFKIFFYFILYGLIGSLVIFGFVRTILLMVTEKKERD